MSKTIIIAVVGVLVGVAAALGIFMFVLGGGQSQAEEPAAPVKAEGRLGPHLELKDRIYNLQSTGAQTYLKLAAIIEFEVPEESAKKWARVFNGCAAQRAPRTGEAMVSRLAVPAPASTHDDEAKAGDPCAAEEAALQAEFEHHIGTGKALIDDAVLTVVSRRTLADVSTPEGKEALKADIKKAVEKVIHHPKVVRVLFTNFITQ